MGSSNFSGHIPSGIGLLHSLSFLELSENRFTGEIPPDIGDCARLEMVDLRANKLQGTIPESFQFLADLNILDLSMNNIAGTIPQNLGKLTSLNKMVISGNSITGVIPKSLGNCKDLQLLDISRNKISGSIPEEIGRLQGLDILLNFSWNALTGPIPESFSYLSKLANLDLSHNKLTGSLMVLGGLDNLVSLDVSFNNFSGILPDTKLFHNFPTTAFSGNQELCINRTECLSENSHAKISTRNLIVHALFSATITIVVVTVAVFLFIRVHGAKHEDLLDWHFTPFQKLNFSVNDTLKSLNDLNIIGKGCSGVVFRVETPTKQVVAVKKLWPIKNGEYPERDLFSAEVQTLGSIRHKNIVRLLGCCDNGKTRLLLFDYISNGSLAGLLHEKNMFLDWDARYKIILGAAQGLSYLHHDCIPPIVHRDIKANNILVGPQFDAFLADFGLAKLVDVSESPRASNTVAGSYGYIAPEYGYNMWITEKSDVYSFGVVLLEVLTGLEPTDNSIPDGVHIITWINTELREKRKDFTTIIDQMLLLRSGTQIHEMLQVLGVALLCVNPCPKERPTMKDVLRITIVG
ncbi:RGF1 INSENSITIVE 2 [Hibiscus trionum]|uniref:RGF1 INSENSITIVE 2 n=1 Tax=Hibiscus trionum TaxID=183268 RepID=A0A9W7MFK6_HIBTR|nr:RGF1 INSENSITIVE 2 [Hibiscus trionum]